MDRKSQQRLSRTPEVAILGVAISIVVAIGVLSYMNAGQTRNRVVQLRRARDIQRLNAQLLLQVTSAETGQRGFLLTGQTQYLRPYHEAVSAIPGIFDRLEARAASLPDQAARIEAVHQMVVAKLAELRQTLDMAESSRKNQALAVVSAGRGQALMENIRARCDAINEAAETSTAEFNAASDLSTSRLRIGSTIGSVLLLGLVILSAIIISRGFERREELFQEAQRTRELLATTLASIADAVISTDAGARIAFMNPMAERLTGWNRTEAVGRLISEVFCILSEITGETVASPLERALEHGEIVGLANHTKLIARDGSEIFIDDSAAPIRDGDGAVIGAVLVFRDISGKRRVDIELAQSADALKRSNEELQQFAFAASHDLRSPLNSVNAMAQLLARRFGQKLGEEGAEMIGYITEGVGRMSRLVDDLLSLALAGSIARDVTQPTNMHDALQAAIQGLSIEIQETGALITFSELPYVAALDTHVIQVIQNILCNALKYRGLDYPRIHVSASPEGAEWIVCVKDNGIGFDPKYAEQIFQPFKRLHGSEYKGSGIGLSTCRKIVAVYGGRIWAESEPGRGAGFFFSLPACQPESVSAKQCAAG
jgi:PAS domain S-box-containing protein